MKYVYWLLLAVVLTSCASEEPLECRDGSYGKICRPRRESRPTRFER